MFLKEKNTRKKILSWVTAAIAAVICVNFFCIFFIRETGGAERSGGAVYAVSQPGKVSVNCEEGYGFNRNDKNGYTNTTANLAEEGYVLILGNSMTRGTNVMPEDRYVQQLNRMIANSIGGDASETAYVYSVTRGGALFAELASGYDAALAEFPNAKAIVIQLAFENRDLGLSPEYLQQVYNQRAFDYTQTAEYIFENEVFTRRFKHWIKNTFPLIPFAENRRFNRIDSSFADAFGINWSNLFNGTTKQSFAVENNNDVHEKVNSKMDIEEALIYVLSYLNKKNDIPLILLDMPQIESFDENLIQFRFYDKDIWIEACDKAGVTFIGMTEEFENLYLQEKKLPYGYSNTALGEGHLNVDGNRVVAQTLYKKLMELEVIE